MRQVVVYPGRTDTGLPSAPVCPAASVRVRRGTRRSRTSRKQSTVTWLLFKRMTCPFPRNASKQSSSKCDKASPPLRTGLHQGSGETRIRRKKGKREGTSSCDARSLLAK